MDSAEDYRCVGAIDFGTTYSGWAYSFTSDPDNIHLYWDWGQCLSIPRTCKAPTSVLLDPNGCFMAFGYEAYQAFYSMRADKAVKYSFFTHYKMHLHDTKPLTWGTELTAIGGQTGLAMDIFGMTLQYLSESLMQEVRKNTDYSELTTSDIKWVITVPAIWSEESKKFMRQAAVKGGMIGNWNSNQLIIALEPEAASLHCHTLNIDVFDKTGKSTGKMAEGTNYLVLDCGGGTLDITAHALLPNHEVEELYHVSGDSLGGMLVNKNFEKLMADIFGDNVINEFIEHNSSAWMRMVNEFEIIKRSINPYSPIQSVSEITLHPRFVKFYEELSKVTIDQAFKRKFTSQGITENDHHLQLSYDAMMNLYSEATTKIVDFVTDLLQRKELRTITHILLVGGFGESKVLQDAIKMRFQNNFRILVPQDAGQCVLKGAIRFAYPPDVIIARRARKTYGYNTNQRFDPKIHDPTKIKMIKGEKYAADIFKIFVKKGERVEVGNQKSVTLYPLKDTQKALSVTLYHTDDEPMYIDDDSVVKLGKVRINLPGTGKDRRVEVFFAFGSTEIEVRLIDPRDDGDMQGTKIDFLLE